MLTSITPIPLGHNEVAVDASQETQNDCSSVTNAHDALMKANFLWGVCGASVGCLWAKPFATPS